MCGRYGLTIDQQELLSIYLIDDRILEDIAPRYNIAPSTLAPVIRTVEGRRRVEEFRWGLIPSWAKDQKIAFSLINARSETVASKPSFRGAWRAGRRCLIPVDRFYEWRKAEGKGPKTPFHIGMADARPFAFAGLWESWAGAGGETLSFTILTTAPNAILSAIDDRMPVILGDPDAWGRWLDPELPSSDLVDLFEPFPHEEMHAYEVSTFVNKPGNEGPECVARVEPAQ